MRRTNFKVGATKKGRDKLTLVSTAAFVFKVPLDVGWVGLREAWREDGNVNLLSRRRRHIRNTSFNISFLSDLECVTKFRLKKLDMGVVCETIGWEAGQTARNSYNCDSFTAFCIVLRRLAALVRWFELEREIWLHSSHSSEVFWEVVHQFCDEKGLLLSIRSNLLRTRANIYSTAIFDLGVSMLRCIGFLDYTEIQMCRPGGSGSSQRSVYSGHKRVYFLIYQTMTTPDDLLFFMYGPMEGHRHDLTLLRESGWEQVPQE